MDETEVTVSEKDSGIKCKCGRANLIQYIFTIVNTGEVFRDDEYRCPSCEKIFIKPK